MADTDNTPATVTATSQDARVSWDGGASVMMFLLLGAYAGVQIGREVIRARTAIRIAEINAETDKTVGGRLLETE